MGNNLKIMGNTFSNVSSITAHDATSGTHTYYDNSQVDAVASDVRSGKKIMNSNGEVTGTLASYTPITYDLTNTTWRFKDYSEMSFPSFQFDVRFISNDIIFKRMVVSASFQELEYLGGNKSETNYTSTYHSTSIWLEIGWVNAFAPFRVVKFLENGNTTSEFFDWLNNNATLVSAEGVFYNNVQVNSFNGDTLSLQTSSKVCEQNISVYNKKPEVDELDVNFIDYDGTILYSYGYQEFANLSAFPTCACDSSFNPFYQNAGWNYSNLTNAKSYVAENKKLWIGKQYAGSIDAWSFNTLKIKIKLEEEFISPSLGLGINGSIAIDWGDGSGYSLVSGTDVDTLIFTNHTYGYAGEFWITISIDRNNMIKILGDLHSLLLVQNNSNATSNRGFYQNCIKEVWINGQGCELGDYAFAYCGALEKVILSNNITTIPYRAFYVCASLRSVVIPNGVTSIGQNAFDYCCTLSKISLPNSITTMGTNTFSNMTGSQYLKVTIPNTLTAIPDSFLRYNYSQSEIIIPEGITSIGTGAFHCGYLVKKLNIPSTVTDIGSLAFGSMFGLQEIRFNSTTAPTIANSDAFNNLQTDCKIYFPITWDGNNSNINSYAYGTNYPGGYGEDYNRKFIGYGSFSTSTTLPNYLDSNWEMHWYATKKEAVKDSGTRLTKGNGTEIYCRMRDTWL